MTRTNRPAARLLACALAATGMAAALPAYAENHALIMWIGQYANSQFNLPGIHRDAAMARQMASSMGVAERNIEEVKNHELTQAGISAVLNRLSQRIKEGDKVFIYYSGHGAQIINNGGGSKCSEGLVTHEAQLYLDATLQQDLERLATRASQVVMFNDSCFSGGAATKAMAAQVAKAYPGEVKAGSANDSGYRCGNAVNQMKRTFEVVGRQRGAQLLYLAAAADNEVSFATEMGSTATQAWATCLRNPAADTDRSGSLSGEELKACAQGWINSNTAQRQTITITGNSQLPVAFIGANAGSGTAAVAVNPARMLQDLRAGSDASYQVDLTPARPSMRIGQDYLDFTVSTNKPGYLYILQVGSDGKTYNQLFPNRFDGNNYVNAGTYRLPRETWRLRTGGPEGTSYLMAYVSPVPKTFSKSMDDSEGIASVAVTPSASKTLYAEATGAAAGGSGRYGTSAVVAVHEVR